MPQAEVSHRHTNVEAANTASLTKTCRWCGRKALYHIYITGACSEHRQNLVAAYRDSLKFYSTIRAHNIDTGFISHTEKSRELLRRCRQPHR